MDLTYLFLAILPFVSSEQYAPHCTETERININVNISELFDRITPRLSKLIVQGGIDPMNISDVERNLWVSPPILPGVRQKVKLSLRLGTINNLSTIHRTGSAAFTLSDKLVSIDVGLGFKEIFVTYKYQVKSPLMEYHGNLTALADAFSVRVNVQFSMEDYTVYLRKLELDRVESVRVAIEGNCLVEWLVTPVTNTVIPLFKNALVKVMEKKVAHLLQSFLDWLNLELSG